MKECIVLKNYGRMRRKNMLPEEVLKHLYNTDRIAIQVVMQQKGEYTLNVGDYGYINLLKLKELFVRAGFDAFFVDQNLVIKNYF